MGSVRARRLERVREGPVGGDRLGQPGDPQQIPGQPVRAHQMQPALARQARVLRNGSRAAHGDG